MNAQRIYAIFAGAFALYAVVMALFLRRRAKHAQAKLKRLSAGKLCFHCESDEVKPDPRGIVCERCGELSTHELIETPFSMDDSQMHKLHRPLQAGARRAQHHGLEPRVVTCLTTVPKTSAEEDPLPRFK